MQNDDHNDDNPYTESLQRVIDLVHELFPCEEGWGYDLYLANSETGDVTGFVHGLHSDEDDEDEVLN